MPIPATAPLPTVPVDDFPYPPTDLPESDGVPLDSDWHRLAINLLIESVRWSWRQRPDFYAGGNMFLYFSARQVRNREYRGPDFFLAHDVDGRRERASWILWEEDGKYPDVIIEMLSKTTSYVDLGIKKVLYEKTFGTRNYCCYDRNADELQGWELIKGRYEPLIPNDSRRLWLEKSQLWLGIWHGVHHGVEANWPRFYDW